MRPAKLQWAAEWLAECKGLYRNGAWAPGRGELVESVNPATGQVIGVFTSASPADIDLAVGAARAAFESGAWSGRRQLKARGRAMRQIADLIRDRADELSTLETLDNGKLYSESWGDVIDVADLFDYYAGWVDKHYGEVNPVAGDFLSYTVYEPVGVVAQIVPWNFPLDMAGYKLTPALAMGNSVVIKPSSVTSFSLIRLVEIIDQAEILPPGVLNLILGPGRDAGHLTRHPDVDKIAFTGSTQVGRALVRDSAASNLKTVSLELGGKSPNIIFADAPDLDAAIDRSYQVMFSGKGEKCSEPTRLLVECEVYDQVLAGLKAHADAWKVGDPFSAWSNQGPQVSRDHFEKILEYIQIGKAEGAKVLTGGTRNTDGANSAGFYLNPTIFYDCTASMRIVQEEIFGPVLTVIPFSGEAEAVAIANDSPYGLAAGLWTNDIARSQRVANALRAGQVFINRYGCYDHASPFGGWKESGWGQDLARASLNLYTKAKAIWYSY
ncbi:MAG: aldehyde dehydrogenase family protein [Propionibacteriaceae bacterium]|jgi:aldehyde dehydrogenase (NAD+)|nr:aldehyde dehydrogenase family protein [Propionibacteriaceae bacterium]